MKILVTGAKGFIGRNLIEHLKYLKFTEIDEFDKDCDITLLEEYCKRADFVFHLAGINRCEKESEYKAGNSDLTHIIIDRLKKYNNACPIMYSSSIQALLDNPYGKSKKEAEELLLLYAKETGAKVFLYRFPNVFGKWCRPNYNSVVATFCHNIARNLPITINNPDACVSLVYIDDLVKAITEPIIKEALFQDNDSDEVIVHQPADYYEVSPVYTVTLNRIAGLINTFKSNQRSLVIPDLSDEFTKKLYSTYLSYLPETDICYGLNMHVDQRGSFTEVIKQLSFGQVSVNISKPGIVKGNHWHNTKIEKFVVVSGHGVIRLRNIHSDCVLEYYVSSDELRVVEIPPGYTHNMENLGDNDMVTLIWANESFDCSNPDTYYLEV